MKSALLVLAFFSSLPFIFLRGPIVGVLIYFWASLLEPQFIVSGFAAHIRYTFIAAALTTLAWLFSSEGRKFPPLNKVSVLLIALMIWISITSLFGTGPTEVVSLYWSNSEKMLLMTLMAYALASTWRGVDLVVAVCALSIAYYGFKGGVWTMLHGGHYRVWGPGGPGGPANISDNNLLGAALTAILPLLFYVLRNYCKPCLKPPLLVIIVFTIIGDLFTYSRAALLALGAVTCMSLIHLRQAVALGIVASGIAVGVWVYAPSEWFERMGSIGTYDHDDSAEARLYMWRLSWAMALKHPVLGGGFGWSYNVDRVNEEFAGSKFHWDEIHAGGDQFRVTHRLPALTGATAAHSIWFQVLGDQGFPGLLLFIAILWTGVCDARWLVRHARNRLDPAAHLGRALQASLFAYVVAGSFASTAMDDLLYAIVIIAAASRRIVANQFAPEANLRRSFGGWQQSPTNGALALPRPSSPLAAAE